jgi:predicted transcriptional regulator/transcriptional regulator with XRE-family HTH domain
MSDHKIFAGPRIKKLRTAMGISQTAMAQGLDISASYLNLIERNQRPITVQLILKLSKAYDISPEDLESDADGTVTALKEVFADSLLQGELPGYEELFEVADVAPNVASGIQKLHEGYRQALLRLSELNAEMANGQDISQTALPTDLVHSAMEARANYYDNLDRAAENLAGELDLTRGLFAALQDRLLQKHRITVQTLPIETMPEWTRRFDKHSMRLFVSDRLNSYGRVTELACDLVHRELSDEIDSAVLRLNLKSPEAVKAGKIEMGNYAALALMLPYKRFFQTAKRMKYDVEALAKRFDVSFAEVAVRMTTLGRTKMEGIPFFLQEVDQAGNLVRRLGQSGYPKAKFGGQCPKMSIFKAVSLPQQLLTQIVETAEGQAYFTINRSTRQSGGAYGENMRQTAIMLACEAEHITEMVYAQGGAVGRADVGQNCRLCERAHCAQRAEPPIARPLMFDASEHSVSAFNFKV